MITLKIWPIVLVPIMCVFGFSSDLGPLAELYKTGKVRFEQEFVLDDSTMPGDTFFKSLGTVACDAEGNIYVVDSGAKNIKKFNSHGKFLKTIGREGQGPGEFLAPRLLASTPNLI